MTAAAYAKRCPPKDPSVVDRESKENSGEYGSLLVCWLAKIFRNSSWSNTKISGSLRY